MTTEKPYERQYEGMTRLIANPTPRRIELYATGLSHTMPFDNVPSDDIEFLDDFDTIEEAAEYADTMGCGWYMWSYPGSGKYLGTICVMQGSKAEIREF